MTGFSGDTGSLTGIQPIEIIDLGSGAVHTAFSGVLLPFRETFLRAVRDGVVGYMLKDASAMEIAAAVRCVVGSEAVCPPQLCLALFEHFAQQAKVPSFHIKHTLGLTRREQQLVQLIGLGLTNKEIASQLNLSEQTVKNHVHRMLRKVGANDRLGVVELCRTQGISA